MVIAFTARKRRKVRGTHVEVGDTLYAVKKGDLFFIWAYVHRDMAEEIDRRVSPGNRTDIAANWRHSLEELTPTATRRK